MATNDELIAVASYLSSDSDYGIALTSDDGKSCSEGTCGESTDCSESSCVPCETAMDDPGGVCIVTQTCAAAEGCTSCEGYEGCSESVCDGICQTCQTTEGSTEVDISGPLFTAIANAIRYRNGTTTTITANDFPEAIAAIPNTYTSDGTTYTSLSTLFTAIANSIRSLDGSTDTIVATNFPSAILAVPSTLSFTITDSSVYVPTGTYSCMLGVTWGDYYSKISGLTVSGTNVTCQWSIDGKTYSTAYLQYNSTNVLTTDRIVNGATYTWNVTT